MTSTENLTPESRPGRVGLFLLFGAMYFVQGIAEPTEGLIAQPVRSLMEDEWKLKGTAIGGFAALLSLPWSFKPLYGLLTDFVPLFGTRRRSYLILCSAASCFGLGLLYFVELPAGAYQTLLLLLIPTVAVAFADVVVDGLMVEQGQPLGLTGQLQSVQWTAMYAGGIFAGLAGGWLTHRDHHAEAFLVCSVACGLTLLLSYFFVKEQPHHIQPGEFRRSGQALLETVRNPALLASGAFLFLWSFNPFSQAVIQSHLTNRDQVNLRDDQYGQTLALFSVGAILGSLAYGLYCRRVPLRWLIHLSITTGVLCTLAYLAVVDRTTANVVSVFVGFAYMTGSMVQLDLVARTCPIATAGTSFAVLMSLSNLSISLSSLAGGYLYERWSADFGLSLAFQFLVMTGAAATAACWLLLPVLQRAVEKNDTLNAVDTTPAA